MQRFLRTSVSLPLAGLITFSLAMLMTYLISVEGEPKPAGEELVVELFPYVERVDPPGRVSIEPVDAVEPPPPLPVIPVETAGPPDDDLTIVIGEVPDFADPSIDGARFHGQIADQDEMPVVRIPPVYPNREAERGIEGQCTVQFDLNTNGQPFNVRSGACASPGFARASIQAVQRWRYEPRVENGQAVTRSNMSVTLDFTLND